MFYEKFLIFILFLTPLIFFHELGHFLFARLFGVRVEVFSIGFGPKIFKKQWGDTEYAISIIPLGGYVKMFGDDPLKSHEIDEDKRDKSYVYKSKWARFWIVFGGPLANFVLAFVLFYFLNLVGERVPEVRFGVFSHKSIFAQKGIYPGDVLKKVNDHQVVSPTDFPIESYQEVESIEVLRNDQTIKIDIHMEIQTFFKELMNYHPFVRAPVVVDELGKLKAVSIHPDKVDWKTGIDHLGPLREVTKIYIFDLKADSRNDQGEYELENTTPTSFEVVRNDYSDFLLSLRKQGLYPIDLKILSVNLGDPADKAGIKASDVIISLNQDPVLSFEDLRYLLQKTQKEEVSLEVVREGQVMTFKLIPMIREVEGVTSKLMGVHSSGEFLPSNFVDLESKGIFGSLVAGLHRTWQAVIKVASGFKKLITNEVSLKAIGGPLAIGKVAADSFNFSLSYFFQIMAFISVNLGLINLFPIPILDGGHIMFIMLEWVNGGPLSRRKMEIAQQFGLSLLLLLMVAALFNDFSRLF